MAVRIHEWSYNIPTDELGQELKDRSGRNRLGNLISGWLQTNQPYIDDLVPDNLQGYIDFYGEQVTVDAVADIKKYFDHLGQSRNALERLEAEVPRLVVRVGDIRPSNTAISVIGEGLAGWYLQRQRNLRFLSRPVGEGPDFVFQNTRHVPNSTILVEVKTTQQVNIKFQMKEAAIKLLQYARITATSGSSFSCIVVGVIIKTHEDFELYNLEINLH